MRFEELYYGWHEGNLSHEEAAQILGVCSRTFRLQICRYEAQEMVGLSDKRMTCSLTAQNPLVHALVFGEPQ